MRPLRLPTPASPPWACTSAPAIAIRNFKKGFGGEADAHADAPRQDAISGGGDPSKGSSRSPASASKDA